MAIEFTVELAFRVVIYPAPDMPGKWIAHGLETDIVTQGDSREHASQMMTDAIDALADHNARAHPGRMAIPLRPAPREVWDLVGRSVPSRV